MLEILSGCHCSSPFSVLTVTPSCVNLRNVKSSIATVDCNLVIKLAILVFHSLPAVILKGSIAAISLIEPSPPGTETAITPWYA